MKDLKRICRFSILQLLSFAFAVFMGCDSGKKTVDQVTGKETVRQFEKSKEKINDIADKQSERLDGLDEDDPDKEMNDEFSEEDE
jgi:hypothetical protein